MISTWQRCRTIHVAAQDVQLRGARSLQGSLKRQ